MTVQFETIVHNCQPYYPAVAVDNKIRRLEFIISELVEACEEAIALSDKNLPEHNGIREPECQRVYDIVKRAIQKSKGEGV